MRRLGPETVRRAAEVTVPSCHENRSRLDDGTSLGLPGRSFRCPILVINITADHHTIIRSPVYVFTHVLPDVYNHINTPTRQRDYRTSRGATARRDDPTGLTKCSAAPATTRPDGLPDRLHVYPSPHRKPPRPIFPSIHRPGGHHDGVTPRRPELLAPPLSLVESTDSSVVRLHGLRRIVHRRGHCGAARI